jgi:putative transposase
MEIRRRRGFDAGKLVKGRKRHLLVDTLGLVMAVEVRGAHSGSGWGQTGGVEQPRQKFSRLRFLPLPAVE